jgi:serine beta-lactamase-like protein LACTB, mitochondrial
MQMSQTRFPPFIVSWLRKRVEAELFCFVFICTALNHCIAIEGANERSLSQHIDALIRAQIRNYNIPGLSVAVTRQNRTVFSRSYGWADLENRVHVTSETLFRIGSITKPITATAAMRRQLDLDQPVQGYCRSFPQKSWPVTTRDLLAHLGGVRGFTPESGRSSELFSNTHYDHLSDSIALFANDPLAAKPGTRYEYSNYGYDLIGCVLEGASGKSFEDLLRSTVFKLAGMTVSKIDDSTEVIPNRSRSYAHAKDGSIRNAACIDTSNRIAAAGLLSSADDLTRFVLALESGKLLHSPVLESMWTEQRTTGGNATGYGLGWMIRNHRDTPVVAHTGELPGASTILYIMPSKHVSFVVLADSDAAGLWKLADRLADLLTDFGNSQQN